MVSTKSAAEQHATKGEYLVVKAAVPGMEVENIGILLLDSDSDRLHGRFRRDFDVWAGDDADWFEGLDELFERAQELGGQKCLEWMESTFSHAVSVSERVGIFVDNYRQTLHQLYVKHVLPRVLPFRTHLPLFQLEAAAGKFGERVPVEVEPEGWVEVWGQTLTQDMFVTHVRGYSMAPEIPDGSLCVINGRPVDSHDGKVVLVEQYGDGEGSRYTIKRYRISKNADPDKEGDAGWLHERMTLESDNPDYQSWDEASARKVRVLGEFLFVVTP